MADQQPAAVSRTRSSLTPRMNPVDVLCSVAGALSGGRVEDLIIDTPLITTTANALEKVNDALTSNNRHRELMISRAKTRAQRLRLQKLAKDNIASLPLTHPLRVRNSLPASELPAPKRPSTAQTQKLKENFLPANPQNDPYILLRANLDEKKLAALSGVLDVTAIDGDSSDTPISIRSDYCLWDSGAHMSLISDDLIREQDPEFLDNDIHEPYRLADGLSVQVTGLFGFSGCELNISTVFVVMPLQRIPNQRSGIILGQSGFIDQIVFESTPRAILQKRGETVKDDEWGDLKITAYVDHKEEVVKELA